MNEEEKVPCVIDPSVDCEYEFEDCTECPVYLNWETWHGELPWT